MSREEYICGVVRIPSQQLTTGYYPCTLKIVKRGEDLYLEPVEIGPDCFSRAVAEKELKRLFDCPIGVTDLELDEPLSGEMLGKLMRLRSQE